MADVKTSTFSQRLQQIMNIREVRAADVCRATGLNKAMLSQYINGKNNCNSENFEKLCKYFNVSYGWLLGYDCPMDRTQEEIDIENFNELKQLIEGLDSEQVKQILDFARFVKNQNNKK